MGKSVPALFIAVSLLSGCVTTPPPTEAIKSIYAMEPKAREMRPQADVALLYFFAERQPPGNPTRLVIDRTLGMEGEFSKDQFYVFCLEPGNYVIEYVGRPFITDRQETLSVKAGDIIARLYSQGFVPGKPFELSRLIEVKPGHAREMASTARLGTDWAYSNSRFRCRTLS